MYNETYITRNPKRF